MRWRRVFPFFSIFCVCVKLRFVLYRHLLGHGSNGEKEKKNTDRQTEKKTNKEYKEVQFVRKYAGGNLDGIKEEKYVYVRGKLTHTHTHIYI